MKKKLAIAIVISLVMLLTLALPTLAAPTAVKGELSSTDLEGTGKYIVQATHDNHIRVTILLNGAEADNYDVYLIPNIIGSVGESVGIFTVNKGGSGAFSGVTDSTFTADDSPFQVRVYNNAGGINTGLYWANNVEVTFFD